MTTHDTLLPMDPRPGDDKRESVTGRTRMGKTTIYQMVARGSFPAPVKIGCTSRWLESEVDAWIEEQAKRRDVA